MKFGTLMTYNLFAHIKTLPSNYVLWIKIKYQISKLMRKFHCSLYHFIIPDLCHITLIIASWNRKWSFLFSTRVPKENIELISDGLSNYVLFMFKVLFLLLFCIFTFLAHWLNANDLNQLKQNTNITFGKKLKSHFRVYQ